MIFEPQQAQRHGKNPSPKTIVLICGAVVLILVGALIAVILKTNSKDGASAQANEATETSQRIIEKVGKIYQLPSDENATVALVQDKSKLAGQPFFSSAQNGDYILVYSKTKLALVYREKDNKLINVGPISLQADKPTVAVMNGSGANDRLQAALSKLQAMDEQIVLASQTSNANDKNTSNTIVVDVSGQNPQLASQIAQVLGAKTQSSVPATETIPANAGIVVIVGKN